MFGKRDCIINTMVFNLLEVTGLENLIQSMDLIFIIIQHPGFERFLEFL